MICIRFECCPRRLLLCPTLSWSSSVFPSKCWIVSLNQVNSASPLILSSILFTNVFIFQQHNCPNLACAALLLRFLGRAHTHIQQDYPERVIGQSLRPLPTEKKKHDRRTSVLGGNFFVCSLYFYLYFFAPIVLALTYCPLLYNTHNTNNHAPWRVSNPQSQQAIGRRPSPQTGRPLGSPDFEPAIPAIRRRQICPLDLTASGRR